MEIRLDREFHRVGGRPTRPALTRLISPSLARDGRRAGSPTRIGATQCPRNFPPAKSRTIVCLDFPPSQKYVGVRGLA